MHITSSMAANKRNFWEKLLFGFLFLIYLAFLFYVLFFAEAFGRVVGSRRYNLTLFHEIGRFYGLRRENPISFFINIFGNVLAFMPFGFFLPRLFEKCKSAFVTMGYSFLFSLTVEFIQLIFKVGCFDIDDLFLNTIGGLLGFLVAAVMGAIAKRSQHVS